MSESPAIARLSDSLAQIGKIVGEMQSGPTEPMDVAGLLSGIVALTVRSECVKLVVQHSSLLFGSYTNAETIVSYSRVLADFIQGTADAEVIGAVRELAKKVA